MDPIHPILPQKPNIAPVTEPPRVGRIDRRDPRERRDDQRRRQDEDAPEGRVAGKAPDAWDAEETGPHVDITA